MLDALSAGYLEKRMALRRPAGAFAFFQQETSEFRDELARLKTQMGAFNRDAGVASVELERELTVRKLLDGQGSLFETREKVADAAELRQVDDGIPKELERICFKAMSKRAAERYMTAKDWLTICGTLWPSTSTNQQSNPDGDRRPAHAAVTAVVQPRIDFDCIR